MCTRCVLSVGWPLGDIILLSRPLQNVSKGSLVDISSGSGLFWGQQANRIIGAVRLISLDYNVVVIVVLGLLYC
jgi:hypothetical protein